MRGMLAGSSCAPGPPGVSLLKMSTLEKIHDEVRQLDARRQEEVLAFVEWVAVREAVDKEDADACGAADEADDEWAAFENRAGEASV